MSKGQNASKALAALFSVGRGFSGGVHAVLRDFVDAAGGRLDLLAEEMVEG